MRTACGPFRIQGAIPDSGGIFRYSKGNDKDGVGRKHGTKRGEGKIKVMIAALS
jgi:hypothetical protein